MFRHRVAVVFCVVQLVGIACSWLYDHPPSAASPFLWNTAFMVLFPGNIIGVLIIEKIFWHHRLSLLTMDVAAAVAVVAINACCWLVVALMIEAVRRRVRSAKFE
jgi:hypothetical protein